MLSTATCAAVLLSALTIAPSAAPAAPVQLAQTTPIKPADVMGDKNRSGPDGWVQAPVSRDEAPAQQAKSAGEPAKPKPATAPAAAAQMKPGDDPGTPMAEPAHGPGPMTGTGK